MGEGLGLVVWVEGEADSRNGSVAGKRVLAWLRINSLGIGLKIKLKKPQFYGFL